MTWKRMAAKALEATLERRQRDEGLVRAFKKIVSDDSLPFFQCELAIIVDDSPKSKDYCIHLISYE